MPANPFAGDGISVKVSGDASGATRALGSVQSSLLTTRKLALGLGGVLAGALAAKGLGAAIDSARSFEEAMVEVQKVTDPETGAAMSGRMRELATEIPVAANELAGLAADAARFGVRGEENIQSFTETVAKMATATDLSTNEAGEAFARLATLTETPVDEMENLGSAVNSLSNNMATSSGEIIDSMLRSSAALNQFGLSNTEIVGMSAALNEVSESSRRAGTRLRRVAQELMNPKKVDNIAGALGMTADEFKNIRREDPARLVLQMAEAFDEGGQTADNLRKNLSTASRQAVAGLAQNLDGLREALDLSNSSFEEGTSLQREFDAATQTFNARLQVFRNRLNEIGIEVGNKLLPVLTPLLDDVSDGLIPAFDELLGNVLSDSNRQRVTDIASKLGEWKAPLRDIFSETVELIPKLVHLADNVLPSLELTLEGIADSLRVIAGVLRVVNDAIDRLAEAWQKVPEPVREGLGQIPNPQRGRFFRMIRENDPRLGESGERNRRLAAGVREGQAGGGGRGPNEPIRIVLEERTDVVNSRIDSRAETVVIERQRRNNRRTGPTVNR